MKIIKNKFIIKKIFVTLIFVTFLISLISAASFGYDTDLGGADVTINTFTGNLTNLSEMQDVDVTGASNNDVLTYNSATSKWIDQSPSGGEPLWNANYSTFLTHIDWGDAVNGTLAQVSTILGFNYYNSTDFDINDYLLESNTTLIGNYSASTDFCIDGGACISGISAGAEPLWNANYSTFLTHIDWSDAVNGTLLLSANWNATNTSYYLVTNPFGYYNSTNQQTETDPLWTGNQTNMLVNCSASNYAYGVFVNGTLKCRADQTGGAGGNPFDQVLNTTSNVTFNNLTVTNNISTSYLIVTSFFRTVANDFFWNIYDDGSDLILNVTNGGGDFQIEQDNSKIKLFNSPLIANQFKVFQVFSKEAGDVTEFTITKAGVGFASYFVRSLAIAGNSTNNPTPFNCSTYASFIDCDTDGTGADLWIEDDVELQGTIYVGENINASGNITSNMFFFGNGSQLTDVATAEVLWNANYSTFLTHINWTNAVNGTLLLSANWNATNTSYYLASNPFGFFNSTNPSPETFWNANYSTFLTHITWTNAINGTLLLASEWNATNTSYYLVSNPFTFWNDTYATFNKTFADSLYVDVGGDTMTGNLNISNGNITIGNSNDRYCLIQDCSSYIYNNGTHSIWK